MQDQRSIQMFDKRIKR